MMTKQEQELDESLWNGCLGCLLAILCAMIVIGLFYLCLLIGDALKSWMVG